jgi:hypothetical protein
MSAHIHSPDAPSPATDTGGAKLVCRTFLDGGSAVPGAICVKLYQYGDGYVEATAYHRPAPHSANSPEPKEPPDERRSEENARRASNRAKSKVRRLVMARNLTHMLTLTTRTCITDPVMFWGLWERFVRLVRDQISGWQYVAVPEPQKRKAIHIHAAVKGYQQVRLLRQLWHQVLQERGITGGGSVNVRPPKNARRPKMARYLTKYITKAFDDGIRDFGGHRYRASQGENPEPTTLTASSWRTLRDALEEVFEEFGVSLAGSVDLDCAEAIWGCSWDRDGWVVETSGYEPLPP